jgi:hypothetical protein
VLLGVNEPRSRSVPEGYRDEGHEGRKKKEEPIEGLDNYSSNLLSNHSRHREHIEEKAVSNVRFFAKIKFVVTIQYKI